MDSILILLLIGFIIGWISAYLPKVTKIQVIMLKTTSQFCGLASGLIGGMGVSALGGLFEKPKPHICKPYPPRFIDKDKIGDVFKDREGLY